MPPTRLDQLLVIRGLAESRARAQALIMAGAVRVDNQVQTRPGYAVSPESDVSITAPLPYVSRGGFKLAHALDTFRLNPAGLMALDVGASTGGFTDVLLQRGARHVYAVDVGYGVLDWRLRQDARVTVLERTNIRYLEALPPPGATETRASDASISLPDVEPAPPQVQCVTIDVSFISLRLVLPAVQRLVAPDAWLVVLIKPQFEAGPQHVRKGGVVCDPDVHRRVLREVLAAAVALHISPRGLTRSPLTGPAGNIEFLVWLQPGELTLDLEQAIAAVLI